MKINAVETENSGRVTPPIPIKNNPCGRFTRYLGETRIAKGISALYLMATSDKNKIQSVSMNVPIQVESAEEASQILCQKREAVFMETPRSEDKKYGSNPTQAKPNFSLTMCIDTLGHTTRFLSPNDIGCCARVCKSWQTIVDSDDSIWEPHAAKIGINPSQLLPRPMRNGLGSPENFRLLRTIADFSGVRHASAKDVFANPYPKTALGKQEWIKVIGDPGIAPPLPSNIHEILKGPCPFWPGKTVEETHTLMLIPKTITVMDKGAPVTRQLTLNLIQILGKYVNVHFWIPSRNTRDEILKSHGDTPIEKSYWILITNDVIPQSREKDYAGQIQLVASHPGYIVPRLRDMVTTIMLKKAYLKIGNFGSNPVTLSRCQEMIMNGCPLVAGSYMGRLFVNYNDSFNNGCIGITAMRKLSRD